MGDKIKIIKRREKTPETQVPGELNITDRGQRAAADLMHIYWGIHRPRRRGFGPGARRGGGAGLGPVEGG